MWLKLLNKQPRARWKRLWSERSEVSTPEDNQADPSATAPEIRTTPEADATVQAAAAAAEVAPAAETTVPALTPFVQTAVPKQRVQGDPPNEPLMSAAKNTLPLISMPSALDDTLSASQGHLPAAFERPELWASVLEDAEGVTTQGEFEQALQDPNANWERAVMHGDRRLSAQNISTPSIEGKGVSGDQALLAFRSHSRGSAGGSVYFWGSGVSGKFNAMPNERMYHLQREIASSRILLGRATYGMALSQHMVYTVEAIVQAAREMKYKSSLSPDIDIGDALRITDFHTLVWALAVSTFPQGFDIERGCVAEPTTCHHVVRERVAVRRMQIVNRSAISDEQRAFMALLQEDKSTLEDLAKYQTMFPTAPTGTYTLEHESGQTTTMHLGVPTLNQFIASGKLWCDEINRAVITAVGETASFAERNKIAKELTQVANARQFSHWVTKLELGGGYIDQEKDIRKILAEEVSSEDNLLSSFIKAVHDFNEKRAVAIIAVNNFKCPSCKKHQMVVEGHEGEEVQPATYVPVEAVSTFFALMYQKLEMAPRS